MSAASRRWFWPAVVVALFVAAFALRLIGLKTGLP
jgi:hypothetical protein